MKQWKIALALIVLLATPVFAEEAAQEAPDHWSGLSRLEGSWTGSGTGFGQTAPVQHTWAFVLGGPFLRLETVSGAAGHERGDVGYISFDKGAGTHVFRQFFSEGFVNTYDVAIEGEKIVFEYRDAESAGPMKARLILIFTTDDTYTMELELASGDDEFAACQTMEMTRQ